MFKQIWDRVIVSYKSTLVGLACGIGVILIDAFVASQQSATSPYLKALAALAVVVGASLKSKALPPA